MGTLKLSMSEKVTKELTEVSADTLKETYGRSTLLHISPDKNIKEFVPRVSLRGLLSEDRTVPRVSTSVSLTHCIAGAGIVDGLFSDDSFDGMVQIYAFDVDVAFKPSTKLVKDATQNKEYWLLGTSPETNKYHPRKVGQIFLHSMTSLRQLRTVTWTFFVQVNNGEEIALTPKVTLGEGYWKFTGENTMSTRKSHGMRKPVNVLECIQIDKDEYDKQKMRQKVSLESVGRSKLYQW